MVSITTYGSVVVELVRGFMVKLAEEKSHIGVGWEVGVYIRVCLGFNFGGPFYNKAHTKCEAKVLRGGLQGPKQTIPWQFGLGHGR